LTVLAKRSLTIAGHRTSLALETEFWDALDAIASARSLSLAALIREIDERRRGKGTLSSTVRVYVLKWFRNEPAGR